MKPYHVVGVVLVAAIISVVGGFWVGFGEGWDLGGKAIATPRGVVALGQLRLIEAGRTDDLKFQFEADVDSSLMWWHDIARSPLRPALNVLSGSEVFPEYEKYVRRLATYRKSHPSPMFDAARLAETQAELEKTDPVFAADLEQGQRESQLAIEEVVSEYAEQ
jgi:hypothetical protein